MTATDSQRVCRREGVEVAAAPREGGSIEDEEGGGEEEDKQKASCFCRRRRHRRSRTPLAVFGIPRRQPWLSDALSDTAQSNVGGGHNSQALTSIVET